ncbi:hypothetical protein [Haloplanus halophilus]|uniref:hypothetical protein n=1 Tax=Haloplanus halophilus TaxID=2949993 RepID=UPI00203FA50E|nr:hypothetical protein [Haloplanus sp. GDY1]
MPTRRTLLAAVGGALVGGGVTYAGDAATESGYGSIEWANELDEEVRVRTVVRSDGGPLAGRTVVYENDTRLFPTDHYRAVETNAVRTGTYGVEVAVTIPGRSAPVGPASTTWTPAGCHHQRLIVLVTRDPSVEFLQREC